MRETCKTQPATQFLPGVIPFLIDNARKSARAKNPQVIKFLSVNEKLNIRFFFKTFQLVPGYNVLEICSRAILAISRSTTDTVVKERVRSMHGELERRGGGGFFFWTNELSQLLVYDVPTTTALYLIFVTS